MINFGKSYILCSRLIFYFFYLSTQQMAAFYSAWFWIILYMVLWMYIDTIAAYIVVQCPTVRYVCGLDKYSKEWFYLISFNYFIEIKDWYLFDSMMIQWFIFISFRYYQYPRYWILLLKPFIYKFPRTLGATINVSVS